MTAPIHIDVAAAQDAQARSDDGLPAVPGDADLIALHEGCLQAASDRYWDREVAELVAPCNCEDCPDDLDGVQ